MAANTKTLGGAGQMFAFLCCVMCIPGGICMMEDRLMLGAQGTGTPPLPNVDLLQDLFKLEEIPSIPENETEAIPSLLEQWVNGHDIETTRQDAYLLSYGLFRHSILGDGNCLFRSISFALYGHENNHMQLRNLAATTLRAHPDQFENYLIPDEGGATQSESYIQEYLENLGRSGTFAGQESVLALAKALEIDILVTQGGGPLIPQVTTIEHSFGINRDQIHIIYTSSGSGHYEAVTETSNTQLNDHQPHIFMTSETRNYKWNINSQFSRQVDLEFMNGNLDPNSSSNFHDYSKPVKDAPMKNKRCPECCISFADNSQLKQHSKIHIQNKGKCPCLVPTCHLQFPNVKSVIAHAVDGHGADILSENLSFISENEFKEFVKQEESKANTRFIRTRQVKINKKDGKAFQLVCHRDGHNYLHLKKGKTLKTTRKNKKGQCKINGLCPSRMYVSIKKDSSVKVHYIKTHTHSLSFEQCKYLPIPNEIKNEIATMLCLKIPINTILDKIRSSLSSRDDRDNFENVKHFHFIDRKSIHNIKRKIIDSSVIQDCNDAKSVFLRIQSLRQEKFNPVLFYKQQFVEDLSSGLGMNDFMLVLMTEQQLKMYRKFANRILCMDSTHKTNQYSFKLITLLVPDEFRRGYPVAFCISNKENEEAISIFLESVRSQAPDIKVNVIMTDDDNAGWNAATRVFGKDLKQYLCVWHVHKNWRRKLQQLVNSKQIQSEMYAFLCAMLSAKNENEFMLYKDHFLSKYENSQSQFIHYFKTHYENRIEKWAICFRKNDYANVNTNMFLESFHNKLKTFYFGGKRNRRVDILIETLLQIENHIFIEHLKRSTYNIPSDNDISTDSRHMSSMNIPDTSVIQIDSDNYSILSSDGNHYSITSKTVHCTEEHCYIKCKKPPCIDLCLHMYSCSCPDFSTGSNICKHIHKVHCICVRDSSNIPENSENLQLNTPLDKDEQKDDQRNSILKKMNEIHEMMETLSIQINTKQSVQKFRLDTIHSTLKKLIHENEGSELLEETEISSFQKTETIASNAKNELQPRFRSTVEKPGQKRKQTLKAPTESEKVKLLKSITDSLDNNNQHTSTPSTTSSVSDTRGPSVTAYPPLRLVQRDPNIQVQLSSEVPPEIFRQGDGVGIPSDMVVPPNLEGKRIRVKLPDGKEMDIVFDSNKRS